MKRSSTDNGDANDGEALSQSQSQSGGSNVPSWSDFMKSIGEEELESEDVPAKPKKLVVGGVVMTAEQKERMRKANEAKEKRHQELRLKRQQARQAAMQGEAPMVNNATQEQNGEGLESKDDKDNQRGNETSQGTERSRQDIRIEFTGTGSGEPKRIEANNANIQTNPVQGTTLATLQATTQLTLPKTPSTITTPTQPTKQLTTQRNIQGTTHIPAQPTPQPTTLPTTQTTIQPTTQSTTQQPTPQPTPQLLTIQPTTQAQGTTQVTAQVPTQVTTQGQGVTTQGNIQAEPKSKLIELPKSKEGELKISPVEVIIQSAYALEKENQELKNKVAALEQKLKVLNIENSRLRNTNQIITKQNAELLEYSERLLQQSADSLNPS